MIDTGNVITDIDLDSNKNVTLTYWANDAPVITTASLPPASQGAAYTHQLTNIGGIGPFTWSEWVEEPSYASSFQTTSSFAATGVPQGWNDDDAAWDLDLPFAFPYWETSYTRCRISSNGFLDFVPVEESEPLRVR